MRRGIGQWAPPLLPLATTAELPTPLLGACVNAGMRPYLGRIRPENRSARATFMHPYSVATAHHDPRR